MNVVCQTYPHPFRRSSGGLRTYPHAIVPMCTISSNRAHWRTCIARAFRDPASGAFTQASDRTHMMRRDRCVGAENGAGNVFRTSPAPILSAPWCPHDADPVLPVLLFRCCHLMKPNVPVVPSSGWQMKAAGRTGHFLPSARLRSCERIRSILLFRPRPAALANRSTNEHRWYERSRACQRIPNFPASAYAQLVHTNEQCPFSARRARSAA